jgi:hypothetical protein
MKYPLQNLKGMFGMLYNAVIDAEYSTLACNELTAKTLFYDSNSLGSSIFVNFL